VLKTTPTHLTAALLPLRGPTAAGLAFGYKSADDFYLLQLRANRDVWILRRLDGGWQILASSHAEPVPGGDVVSLEIQGDEVTPSINGVAMDARTAPGLVGLNVESGAVDFRVTVDP
jgi:hypothetical protein